MITQTKKKKKKKKKKKEKTPPPGFDWRIDVECATLAGPILCPVVCCMYSVSLNVCGLLYCLPEQLKISRFKNAAIFHTLPVVKRNIDVAIARYYRVG